MIVPCLPAYAASLDLPASSVGLIVAVPAFARACLNLPAGRLADVVGRKRPMIVGSVLDAVGHLNPSPSPSSNPNPGPNPNPSPNQVLDAVG